MNIKLICCGTNWLQFGVSAALTSAAHPCVDDSSQEKEQTQDQPKGSNDHQFLGFGHGRD